MIVSESYCAKIWKVDSYRSSGERQEPASDLNGAAPNASYDGFDEGDRFYGDGLSTKDREILDYMNSDEDEEAGPESSMLLLCES